MTEELDIQLNFRNKKSIAEQLQEEMRRLIQDGVLAPGDQLPTVRSLASQLKVNFNTVARVYRMLDQEGLLSTQQGRGTYVLEDFAPVQIPKTLTRKEQMDRLVSEVAEKAALLRIPLEELQESLQRQIDRSRQRKAASLGERLRPMHKRRLVHPAWRRELVGVDSRRGARGTRRRMKKAST